MPDFVVFEGEVVALNVDPLLMPVTDGNEESAASVEIIRSDMSTMVSADGCMAEASVKG